jgi:CheY-like chemotaxis protein
MDILFVDDDSDDREFFLDALSYVNASLKCVLARNCEEALAKINQSVQLPSYIFLDIHMPAMGGKNCLMAIKENPAFNNCKIVMYSTSADESTMAEYKRLGATYFLIKPSTFKGLCDSLSVMLGG